MKYTAADRLIDILIDWGVETVFGIPGDGVNGIMEALRLRQNRIRFIQTRHEVSAAFMATAYAKYIGKLGVCLATSGPGGLQLINGLYDAKMDGQPVLAITGMPDHDLIGMRTQQDVELDRVFEDVSVYNARVMGPTHVENVVELACRTAISYRGVSHITIPADFQTMVVRSAPRSKRNQPSYHFGVTTASVKVPTETEIRDAARILNKGRRIAIMAGRGALHATDELLELAEILGAPIVKPLLGKASVPDDSVYTTGTIGQLGTRPSQEVMDTCETLIMIGTSFPYMEFMPKRGQARCVQIDLDSTRIGLRYDVDVGLVGDTKATLQKLLPLLVRNEDRSFLHRAQEGMREWWQLMRERSSRPDLPMKPQVIAWELGKRLSSDAIVSADSGTNAVWWARYIPARRGQMHSLSGNLATMSPGLPYTIAAQLAFPERQCVAFVGDGGLSMIMAELATAAYYKLPIKVVVLKNNSLAMIKWEQMVNLGNPEYGCELHNIDFAKVAEACGVAGFTIAQPQDCGRVLDQALNTDGPVLIEAVVDALEPPMPAKLHPEDARRFARSLAKGTSHAGQTLRTVTENQIRELL